MVEIDCTVKPKQRGFTLIEMLVVVTIIGILSSIALPNYSQYIANSKVLAASEEIRRSLASAKVSAIKRNTKVEFSATGSAYDTFSVSVTAVNNTPDLVSFTGNGYPVSAITYKVAPKNSLTCIQDGGTITCLNVLVTSGGLIKVCNPNKTECVA